MKRPKNEVDYSPGMEHSHCGPWKREDPWRCQHFEGAFMGRPYKQGACRKVAGPINPKYWCKLYSKV